MKTMKDYHDLYLKCNVLLLTYVFEKFRTSILKNYGFCPSHYLSAPGLSSDAILKMAKFKIKQIKSYQYWHVHIVLKKVQEVEFLIFLIDAGKYLKSTKNIWNLKSQNKN